MRWVDLGLQCHAEWDIAVQQVGHTLHKNIYAPPCDREVDKMRISALSGRGWDEIEARLPEQGDGLQSFSQAHLVGQDTVDAVLIQTDHPVQATNLSR